MSEIDEIKMRYERRKLLGERDHPSNPEMIMSTQEKERKIITLLKKVDNFSFDQSSILEIGCGNGSNLLQLIRLGFDPRNLTGNELLEERAESAKYRLPSVTKIICGNALDLEITAGSFDIVYQSMVFSSILDDDLQNKLAAKMWHWIKPGGGVLWYDFIYNNPFNKDVKGVPYRRVRELFPEGTIFKKHLTLAPPLSRHIAKINTSLYTFFNFFPFLRTHIICLIKKY